MPGPTGHWLCKLGDHPALDTDRLRLREVMVAEQVTGLPYTLLDPRTSAKVAVALFALMLMRTGLDEDAAMEQAQDVELAELHGAFEWVQHDTAPPAGTGSASPPSSAATSPAG